jgi:cation diffusion facilitator family transporter
MDNRSNLIVRASWVGVLGNTILASLKITIGLLSGSMAVVADGIDSATDIVTSFITLFTAKILNKPPNINYPYGYEKADTIATKALAFIIFFAGAQLLISTTTRIATGQVAEMPGKLAIYITIVSILGKIIMSLYLKIIGKNTSSSMLIANARNMQNDVLISSGVLLGLFFTFILELPVIDSITALIVSFWIIKVALQIFFQTNTELMDGNKNPELYSKLFKSVKEVEGAHNPHRVRLRNIGSNLMISMDIEVDPLISVHEAHEIAEKVEESIKKSLPNVYDIVVHIEPQGKVHKNEKFGLSENDVKPDNHS